MRRKERKDEKRWRKQEQTIKGRQKMTCKDRKEQE
jgi:hypothetical protein